MGVFDGYTYRVTALRQDGEEEREVTNSPAALVARHREDPDVKAVEVYVMHYVTGEFQSDLSFGDLYGDEEEEDDE